MSFKSDVLFEDNENYNHRKLRPLLTDDFWSEMLQLFYDTPYTKAERKRILDKWAKILETKGTKGWEHEELAEDARRLTLELCEKTNKTDEKALLSCLSCLVKKERFTAEQLNNFLRKYQFQSYYIGDGRWRPVQDKAAEKKRMVFISHSVEDAEYVYKFIEFLREIGLESDQIICSNIPEYSVPLGEDIYEFLKTLFQESELWVVYMLSQNYYKSAACLNEMGAAWVLHKKYLSILLPGFEFESIQGGVNPTQRQIKLDGIGEDIKSQLEAFRKDLQFVFDLKKLPDRQWDRSVETLIRKRKGVLHKE